MTNHTITIYRDSKSNPARMVRTWVFIVALIGTGAVLGSTAMQWIGFIILILICFAAVKHDLHKNSGLTIAQARARLDEIERDERQ